MEYFSWNPRVMLGRYRELRASRPGHPCIVTINNPRLRIKGKLKSAIQDRNFKYVAFLGIPYAVTPLGVLRFQPPESIGDLSFPQTALLRAYFQQSSCAQRTIENDFEGTENCLHLNVFTPGKPANIPKLLPVLVYIHGGGFTKGSSEDTNPESMLMENLVVVTMNYRLNIFGFLNMRSENCRGNAGMKDQVMALKWVQENIERFKGDPKNVTLCGHSAGGSSVNLHMISPLSKGLFHKAIVMSGGLYCPWGYGGHAKHMKQLFKRELGLENELRNVVVERMKTMETKRLLILSDIAILKNIRLAVKRMAVFYNPSVECIRDGAFLPDTAENLMELAVPVPTIAGIAKEEGYQCFNSLGVRAINVLSYEDEFVDFLRQNFRWKDEATARKHVESIKAIYFPNEEDMGEEEKPHCLATLATDIYFRRFYDNFKIGNLLDEEGPPLYVYEFDYFQGPLFEDYKIVKPKAADHSDIFLFMFEPEKVDIILTRYSERTRRKIQPEMERVQRNLRNLWGSFCRTGVPKSSLNGDADVDWIKHTEKAPHYLQIGKRLTLHHGRLNEKRWSQLNALCESESTVPSLAATPPTPGKEEKTFHVSLIKRIPYKYPSGRPLPPLPE